MTVTEQERHDHATATLNGPSFDEHRKSCAICQQFQHSSVQKMEEKKT